MPATVNQSRIWWAFAGFVAIAAFFLLEEHRAHLLGLLPYLLLLACPFMHMFMHRGHGHGGGESHEGHRMQDESARRGHDSW